MTNTLAVVLTAATAFLITAVLGIWLVPFLKKLKYGQTINDIGPTWHKSKQGTPTMGGILFIAGILVAVTAGICCTMLSSSGQTMADPMQGLRWVRLCAGVIMALAFGCMGFLDDYIKVVKKRNLGLTEIQKLAIQAVITGAYLATLYLAGDTSTILMLPFFGAWEMGWAYFPVMFLAIIFMVNAVNLADGIDGLCGSVTFVASAAMLIVAGLFADTGMSLLAAATAGAMVGFLVWNFHPAKVFMGDTGSMFLGGIVVALAFGLGIPALLIPVGIIYIIDAGSVVLQVASFKLTGKRIFKMTPIHHSFEISGWSEVKIVAMFSVVGAIGAVLAVIWAVRI